ncbi:MAG: sigma-E factor negative regulatory protein [Methylococcales bacterium]|nr:sigma-E factor negative regulatory protein [Methylococcales bacterium]
MPEDLNQKISQFLDNELDHVHALNLLKKMQPQTELQDILHRYEAISNAIKTDFFLLTKSDFSIKIRQQIQQEAVYLLPQQKPAKRRHKVIALAASIVIVAVIAERGINNQADQLINAASTQQVAQHQAQKPVAYEHQADELPLNTRINEYLQAHNSSVYTNGEANFQTFARVTAYSQK